MKKIILAIIAITIISCNKSEKATGNNLKTDSLALLSVKNDTISNTIISDTISKIIVESKKTLAIDKDSSGYYHLNYILEKGKAYPFNLKEIVKQTVSIGDNSEAIIDESYDNISFTVTDIVNGKYFMRINYNSKKIISKFGGETITIYTKAKEPKTEDPNIKRMWKVNKALYDTSFTMEMDKYGKISNIKGMESIYDKVRKELNKELSGKELEDFVTIIKQGFNPEAFKAQFEGTTVQFPEKGVKIGEKWSNDKGNKGEAFNVLKKVDSTHAEIAIQGKIPSKSDSKIQDGMTLKISVSGSQSGKILLDVKTGWISKANLDLAVTQKESASKDGQTQSRTMKSENHSYINYN